ncbi:hypothetical protein ALC62_03927 [Cyphomyrmex costatus]|uniref:Uncharacterized protein n=1 Tax=Cyphomyrmex costatus TaxID=456900 RepID=A0A195CX49_9HYME|nr:hypothetical protein ALC62_03927 [Cyphomyrmex costatus]
MFDWCPRRAESTVMPVAEPRLCISIVLKTALRFANGGSGYGQDLEHYFKASNKKIRVLTATCGVLDLSVRNRTVRNPFSATSRYDEEPPYREEEEQRNETPRTNEEEGGGQRQRCEEGTEPVFERSGESGNDQTGATKRKRKVKCTHVASTCTSPEKKVQRDGDVSVPPPLHDVVVVFVVRRFRSPPIPTSRDFGTPSSLISFPRTTTPYLHRVCNLLPSNHKCLIPPHALRELHEIHEKEPDLPQAVLVSESAAKCLEEALHRTILKRA